jgi:hypothetical protein
MNRENLNSDSEFVEYNDECLEHVSNGPDYGQPWSESTSWSEIDSPEYPDFVNEIRKLILKKRVKLSSE